MSRRRFALPTIGALLASLLVALVPANVALANVDGGSSSDIYIVQLVDSPAVAYDGRIAGLKATRPGKGKKIDPNDADVVRYVNYQNAKHDGLVAKGNGKKIYDYNYTYNGFAATLTASAAAALRGDAAVLSVEKNEAVTMDTATTPKFLGLSVPGGLWDQLGGVGKAGEDVIVGIVDSGIWPDSLSFSDRTGENGNETKDGKLDYHQIPGWHGRCRPGEDFNASNCNKKLIGAQYFSEGRPANDPVLPHEFLSARDYNGHGTHTASTAAGNNGVATTGAAAVFVSISGMAPRARVSAYKVCWDNGEGGCGAYTADSVAAIDQAVADGVDVINYSISGTSTNYLNAVEVAYLFAADAGVFVATSAGNSGPAASTVAHISPWLASVAAGTHDRSGVATATFGTGGPAPVTGASLTNGVGPAPLVKSTDAGLTGKDPNEVRQCFSGTLDPAKVTGKIVTCERGGAAPNNPRVDKSAAVKAAGGVGVIIWNVVAGASINADLHSLPAIHVANADGLAITSYVTSTPGAAATLSTATVTFTEPAPFVASFSSRGPSVAGGGDILKPDFMAPGQDIVASVAPPGNGGRDFDIFSGTSMSSPHVAGLAALLKQAHRDWSPAAIRSALATTAGPALGSGTGITPFAIGSGQVRPSLANNPGLVYDANFNDYLAFLKGQGLCCASTPAISAVDASDLNQPSLAIGDLAGVQRIHRTVKNVGSSSATYTAAVVVPTGITMTVAPSSFTIAAGGIQSFDVTFTRTTAMLNSYAFGSLTWSDGTHSVRSPVAIRPVAISAPAEVRVSGTSGSASYSVKSGFNGTLTFNKKGLLPATKTPLTVTDDPTDNFDTTNPAGNQGIVTYDVAVPLGTTLARMSTFDAYSDGAPDDLDLYVYRVMGSTLMLVGLSGGATAAEQVTLVNPSAATYRVFVHGFNTDGPDAHFTLFTWVVNGDAGNFTAPAPATVTVGGTMTVNVSWTGLTAGAKYLGQIVYSNGTSDIGRTIIAIATD